MKAKEIIDYLYTVHPSLRDDEMAALLARAETAEAALAEAMAPCVWKRADDGTYRDCKREYWNPDDKRQFCPCCGHPIEVAEAQP